MILRYIIILFQASFVLHFLLKIITFKLIRLSNNFLGSFRDLQFLNIFKRKWSTKEA